MFWIKENLGTASISEVEELKKLRNVDVEIVYDLIDGKQENKGQFVSKVKRVKEKLKKGNRIVIVCRGGLSRSNAVAFAVLMDYFKMSFDDAFNLIHKKVPVARIAMELIDFIKEKYAKNICI